MALIRDDRILETTTTTGTGALTLAGAVTGYRAFSAKMTSPSDTCYYYIEGVDANNIPTGEWETGLGTYSGANTLTRTTVIRSSNSDSVVTLSAGTKRVGIALTAASLKSETFAIGQVFRAAYGKPNSTTTSDLGINLATTGTNNLTAVATTSFATMQPRCNRSSSAAAGSSAGFRDPEMKVSRLNGFKVAIMFSPATMVSATRIFAGLTSETLLTNEDPSNFNHTLAFAADAADSNLQRMEEGGTGTATKTDTAIALTQGVLYEAVIECAAGASDVSMTLYAWTGTSATPTSTYGPVTVSADLPGTGQLILPYLWINTGSDTVAVSIDMVAFRVLS